MVSLNDSGYGRQTDPGPFELLLGVKALKWFEQLVGIAHVQANAIVPDIENRRCTLAIDTELDVRVGPL